MTRIISAITLKLFAVYVAVSAAIALPMIAGVLITIRSSAGDTPSVLGPAVIASVTIAVGALLFRTLWRWGNSVTADGAAIEVGAGDDALESLLLRGLGIYFGVTAITNLPAVAMAVWAKNHGGSGLTWADPAGVVGVLIQLAIGVSLVVKAEQWARMTTKIGSFGRR